MSSTRKNRRRLVAMKSDVFSDLGLMSSPRSERVFDLAITECEYIGSDHAMSIEFVKRTMKTHMDRGAFEHLDMKTGLLKDEA